MWRRATRDTASYFGWNKRTVVPFLLWGLGAVIYWQLQGSEAVLEELVVAVCFGLIPVGVFLVFLYLWNLVRAPVYLKFERMMTPCLKVVRSFPLNLDGVGTGYAIEVANPGLVDAKRCHARLIELRFEIPHETISLSGTPPNRDLHWLGQQEGEKYYDAPGGQPSTLNVVYCEPKDGKRILKLAYRSNEDYRVAHALPQGWGAILALIRISYEGHHAIDVVCRIDPKPMVDIVYRSMSGDEPFELRYCGTESVDLSKYQITTEAVSVS